jgi:hypothetical protein
VIVVSDTTAITSLLKIGRADLLRELFGAVFIPEGVRDELLQYHVALPDFLQVHSVANSVAVGLLREEIDAGEAQAIILAEEIRANILLIDDKQGRTVAQRRGIQCLGLAGAILLAKENGLIGSIGDFLNRLESEANFYLDRGLRRELLLRVREAD